ncbi:hypothetical protein DNTS_002057 [Danionella cerebrum]|uniref:Osteoclast-stimulating factor 1 n=1 Tax=Danionella cerebrum TaxID=2873325 RepID=A0A553MZ13_9TELE|nr:hypothetical protein DNTS_002057 [Danionella translucida]
MEVTGKYDFTASADDELSFRKGDVIKILGTTGDWFRAEINGVEGFVPRNYLNINFPRWYQENMTRLSTQDELATKPIGSFIIRGSQSTPGEFSISVRHESDVQHFKVMRDKQGRYYLWSETFTSLNALVKFYTQNSISKENRVFLLTEQKSLSDFCQMKQSEAPPLAHVQKTINPPQKGTQPSNHAPPTQVHALYNFSAEDSDELSFEAGDVIVVLDQNDQLWWRGSLRGRTGLFPVNYTRPL